MTTASVTFSRSFPERVASQDFRWKRPVFNLVSLSNSRLLNKESEGKPRVLSSKVPTTVSSGDCVLRENKIAGTVCIPACACVCVCNFLFTQSVWG